MLQKNNTEYGTPFNTSMMSTDFPYALVCELNGICLTYRGHVPGCMNLLQPAKCATRCHRVGLEFAQSQVSVRKALAVLCA